MSPFSPVHRSNLFTNAFPEPKGRHAHLPTKSVTGVYDTSVNKVWDTIGPRIRDLVKSRKVRYSYIYPGSTSPDTALEVSQDLLVENGIEGTVVEWRKATCRSLQVQPLCAL